MKINHETIKAAFPQKAWAYAEGLDRVQIGKWDGTVLLFAEELCGNKVCKSDAGFFSSREAAGSVDTRSINGFCQHSVAEKRQVGCKGYFRTVTESFEEGYLTELRIFDTRRELKFTGERVRDTANRNESDFIRELADAQYFMYGEQAELHSDYTMLREARGGTLLFPVKLDFPKTSALPNGAVGLKLGIRNFVRYNPVPVLPKGKEYDFGLNTSGAGALEVVDYAYTGFFYEDGKAVEL